MHSIIAANKDLIDLLSLVALVLTFIGLAIAIYQLKKSMKDSMTLKVINDGLVKQLSGTKEINESLEEQVVAFKSQNLQLVTIKESLTTKYLGQFPEFVKDTIDLLSRARKKIDIVCDFPAYCCFTDDRLYTEYFSAINKGRANDLEITLICPDAALRKELARRQFRASDPGWPFKMTLKNKIQTFLDRQHINSSFEDISFEDLYDKIEKLNKNVLETLFVGRHTEVEQEFQLFYWIVDDTQAIFLFLHFRTQIGSKAF